MQHAPMTERHVAAIGSLLIALGPVSLALYTPAILTAGALWLLAFLLYVIALWPVFWGPRQPRKPAGRPPA